MFQNKKAQAMVLDLMMLIVISTVFFMFLSSQIGNQAPDTASIRAKSVSIQRLFITTLNANPNNTPVYANSTVLELIGEYYCKAPLDCRSKTGLSDSIKNAINRTMNSLNKPDHYYMMISCPEGNCTTGYNKAFGHCSEEFIQEMLIKYNTTECCIKTEKINLARLKLDLPDEYSYDFTEIELGIWPKNLEVEPCPQSE